MTTMTCRVCAVIVPTGEFCGNCGATASPRRGDGPAWLRLSAYAAAPGERVLRPAVISTDLPVAATASRMAFGVALVGVVALLVGTALPMWLAALIGLVGFGLPLLFLAYLGETDAVADLVDAARWWWSPLLGIAVRRRLGPRDGRRGGAHRRRRAGPAGQHAQTCCSPVSPSRWASSFSCWHR